MTAPTTPGTGAAAGTGRRAVTAAGAEPSLARSTAVMALGTLLSRVTGLLRVSVLAFALGVTESKLADVYNVANTTPNIVYELVLGGVLSSIFVPVFVEVLRTRGREQADHIARSVMTITFVLLTGLALLCMLASPLIIKVYMARIPDPRLEAEAQRVGAELLVLFMPQVVFYGVGAVMTGLLNANRRFGVPMFAPILNNLVVVAVMLAFHFQVGGQVPEVGELTAGERLLLGLGTTAGVVAMTMVQWPFLRRAGFRYRWAWDLRDPAIRKMAALSAFTLGYVATNQLGYLVVPVLSAAVQGGYTAYSYAFIFFQLPHGIFAVSVMTALLPSMSEHAVARRWPAFRADLSRGLRLTAFVLLPAAVGYAVLAEPIVRLLLVRGVLTAESGELLARVLTVWVAGLLPFSTFQLTLRAFYALQDTRVPLLVNIVAVATQVVADIVLFTHLPQDWKVAGLAIGHSLSYLVGSTLLLACLRPRIGGLDGFRVARSFAQVLAGSAIMGMAAKLAARTVEAHLAGGLGADLATVTAGVSAGLAVYLLAARAFRAEELGLLLEVVRRRRR